MGNSNCSSLFWITQGALHDFEGQNMFWYVSRDADESEKGNAQRKDDKWWLPTVRVPPNGLSEDSSKWLQFQKDSATQVLKTAMAINAQVLMEMEVPEAYIESLPKVTLNSDLNLKTIVTISKWNVISMIDLSSCLINLVSNYNAVLEWEVKPRRCDLQKHHHR